MTSRERILTALQHKEPDRVPCDLGNNTYTGISTGAYRNLLNYLEYRSREVSVAPTWENLAVIDEDLLKRLKVDTRWSYPKAPSNWRLQITDKDGYYWFSDQWGITRRIRKNQGLYYNIVRYPLAGDITEKNVDLYPWPDPSDTTRVKGLREEIRSFYNETKYAIIIGPMGSGILETAELLRGYEDFYCDLVNNPILTCKLMDKIAEIYIKFWDLVLSEIGEYIQVVAMGDDLGHQTGPKISPTTYRRYVKPIQRELYKFIKQKTSAYLFLHTCGSVYDFIPDFIEMGVDALNPVQVSAAKMDTRKLKKEFGKDLTFWGGGVDTQDILPHGTPQQVKDEVKRRIDDLAPGGGFVFAAVHNIQSDVPPENIMAMWEALQEYGVY